MRARGRITDREGVRAKRVRAIHGAAVARTGSILLLAAALAPASVGAQGFRQWSSDDGWARLPPGREWGAVTGVHPDPDGAHIWVLDRCGQNSCLDSDLDPILAFDLDGNLVSAVGAGLFAWPHGFFVDHEGNLWVTDGGTGARGEAAAARGMGHQVLKLSPEGEVLLRLGTAGESGAGNQRFNGPSAVLVAPDGTIFVADGHDEGGNNRIVAFDRWGRYLYDWGYSGPGPAAFELSDPHALGMDSRGRLFVGDRRNARIQIFERDGTFVDSWSQFGPPSSIFIDASDVIYVTDTQTAALPAWMQERRGPDWVRGIRIGDALTGEVTDFIVSDAEFVAVDRHGNVYGAEVPGERLVRHEGPLPWRGPGPDPNPTDPTPSSLGTAGTPFGEWRYWGGDAWSTRSSPLDQIDGENFEQLEVAWIWRTDNYGPSVDYVLRSTPIYANGRLFTVAGRRRTVVAIDPATGETLWTFREPPTARWERSSRQNYGKGVAYYELGGRGVIYVVTPAFFLHALDAETGRPLEGFGGPVPVDGFAPNGTVDLLADLGHPFDPATGIDESVGFITNSSPPIVVDGVVIVGNSNLTGRLETRIENVPGDILAYDARTGAHLWTFHVIPRPGEVGHETWENDAWSFAGNANTWAPISADPERGIVYIATDAPTNDYYGGFRPGDNLFGNSIVALDVRTGERLWHFQTVHHDVWDYDNPLPPTLLDVVVDGEPVPALVQTTKQGFAYALNRVTGEAIWPIEERPVPPSGIPGERLSPTQPHPTRPLAYEMQGLTEDDLIDFTPALRAAALESVAGLRLGPLFNPHLHAEDPSGLRGSVMCPGPGGGANILGGTVADPDSGILYVASVKSCSGMRLVPGSEVDNPAANPAGRTVVDWHFGGFVGLGGPEGLPIFKPPYGRITAIDMNTGEHLWWIPNGDTPDRIRDHPSLEGVEVPNTGVSSHATALVTGSLLVYGEGRNGLPRVHAVDKRTGERLGSVDLPAPTTTAPMTFLHEGVQFLVFPVGGGGQPGALVALRLPDAEIEVTAIRGASTQIRFQNLVIHVDPWSAGDYSNAHPADLILVSDVATDHLDVDAIARIRKPGAPVVIPPAAREAVPDGVVLENGERAVVAGIPIEAVPMYDLIPGAPFHPPGAGNGYILTLDGTRIYFAGVTECVPEIRALRDIDIAFLPMNLPNGRMTPEAAADCAMLLRPGVVYPYHYREQPVDAFVEALRGTGIEVRLLDWYP